MFSASYFNQLERDKGHPKIERVHSTSFTIVFRSKNNNKDDNNNKKSHWVPLGLLLAAEEYKDKDREEFTQEEIESGFALKGWKQGYNK